MSGNKISNFKTFVSTDSITIFFGMGWSYGSKASLLYSVEKKNLKKMELGKNAYAYVALQWVQILSKVAFSFFKKILLVFWKPIIHWGSTLVPKRVFWERVLLK